MTVFVDSIIIIVIIASIPGLRGVEAWHGREGQRVTVGIEGSTSSSFRFIDPTGRLMEVRRRPHSESIFSRSQLESPFPANTLDTKVMNAWTVIDHGHEFIRLQEVNLAMDAAEKAISGITKADLVEIKSFHSPPPLVEKTMIAVCILLGKPVSNGYADVKKAIGQMQHFLEDVRDFDHKKVSLKTQRKIIKHFINDKEWTFENVMRTSKAAAIFVDWVKAQMDLVDLQLSMEVNGI